MTNHPNNFAIIGAGINGLVAANYLKRAGHEVTLLERASRVGGACVAETAVVDGISQDFALGASTLGLMQDYVWRDTGLADRLQIWSTSQPDLVYFGDSRQPVTVHRETDDVAREFAGHWGERGDLAAFYDDEARVVEFLQAGYRDARPPSVDDAITALGQELAALWITGSASDLLDHYFTAEQTKIHVAMSVSEAGPVSLHEPYSAFIVPMMSSGSVFDGGYYGFVRGGIWQITRELGRINGELGVEIELDCSVGEVDVENGIVRYRNGNGDRQLEADHIVFATAPQTAAHLAGDQSLIDLADSQRLLGTSGKLNLMFREPVRWKHGNEKPDGDTAYRYVFKNETLADYEAATMAVIDGADFAPGYYQVYCEGASMRQMGLNEPFDRLAVFFKNLALGKKGDELGEVEAEARQTILSYIDNPEDCAWSRLLTPRDLQQTFGFPAGNIEHTMLVAGQCYDGRGYAGSGKRFYQFGDFENASICAAGTYPCGSVAGTPAYMCVTELLRGL